MSSSMWTPPARSAFERLTSASNLLNRKPYQPAPDLSPRRVFDKLAVSLQQRCVHHILGGYFARQQVASRQIVGDFSADEVVEILQVALGERGEEFALALLGRDGFGLLAPQFFSPRGAFIEG